MTPPLEHRIKEALEKKREQEASKWSEPMWGITIEQGDVRVAHKHGADSMIPHILGLVVALEFYTNYDKETVRHMDTEFLKPSRVAVIKPLDKIGKGYAPEDMHPSQIHQDDVFTYGPKERPGKLAREALRKLCAELEI